jgi:hypothetical protein
MEIQQAKQKLSVVLIKSRHSIAPLYILPYWNELSTQQLLSMFIKK